jgi:hypothetical protein
VRKFLLTKKWLTIDESSEAFSYYFGDEVLPSDILNLILETKLQPYWLVSHLKVLLPDDLKKYKELIENPDEFWNYNEPIYFAGFAKLPNDDANFKGRIISLIHQYPFENGEHHREVGQLPEDYKITVKGGIELTPIGDNDYYTNEQLVFRRLKMEGQQQEPINRKPANTAKVKSNTVEPQMTDSPLPRYGEIMLWHAQIKTCALAAKAFGINELQVESGKNLSISDGDITTKLTTRSQIEADIDLSNSNKYSSGTRSVNAINKDLINLMFKEYVNKKAVDPKSITWSAWLKDFKVRSGGYQLHEKTRQRYYREWKDEQTIGLKTDRL